MSQPARHATGPNGPSPLPDETTVLRWKEEARSWFASLRDRICAEFEKIEDELTGTHAGLPPGRFVRKDWKREAGPTGQDRGGGTMASPAPAAIMPRETAITPLFCRRARAVNAISEGMRRMKRSSAMTM